MLLRKSLDKQVYGSFSMYFQMTTTKIGSTLKLFNALFNNFPYLKHYDLIIFCPKAM